MTLRARIATSTDIPFIVATERLPGFDAFIGRWSAEQHEEEMANPGSAYLIAENREGAPIGFAILRHLDEAYGNALLKRIAVNVPGNGSGRLLLIDAMRFAFARESVHRFHLDVLVENERAQRAYRAVGFQEEGVMREIYSRSDGTRMSALLMSILRPEWAARFGNAAAR